MSKILFGNLLILVDVGQRSLVHAFGCCRQSHAKHFFGWKLYFLKHNSNALIQFNGSSSIDSNKGLEKQNASGGEYQ